MGECSTLYLHNEVFSTSCRLTVYSVDTGTVALL